MAAADSYDALVIGGGFFGLYIAEHLTKRGRRALICEREPTLMARASYVNQARVHQGYHYPRSLLTALRSRVSFPRFAAEFPDCIHDSFQKIYAIGRILSKVNAKQFYLFCQRIGAPCEPAKPAIADLFDPRLIEAVFATTEYAFDACKLRDAMIRRIEAAGVACECGIEAVSLAADRDGVRAELRDMQTGARREIFAGEVYNCAYSQINAVLTRSGLPRIPLKHELAELALNEAPEPLADKAVTVMCGPFFSLMPFPARGMHSLTHVRYTPHFEWRDAPDQPFEDGERALARLEKRTAWPAMIRDARRYLPIIEDCRYRESLWEVKTVLPLSEVDDSRPILFKRNHGLPHVHCVMGGKIDNVYDVVEAIDADLRG